MMLRYVGDLIFCANWMVDSSSGGQGRFHGVSMDRREVSYFEIFALI